MDSLLCERHCRPQLGCRQRDDDDEAEPQLAAFNKQGETQEFIVFWTYGTRSSSSSSSMP
jgi:hypothetical protein